MKDNVGKKMLLIIFSFSESKVPNIQLHKLQPKQLSKLATRLMKLYQIPEGELPTVLDELFLFYRYFVDFT